MQIVNVYNSGFKGTMRNILKIIFTIFLLLTTPYCCLGAESGRITIVKNGGGGDLIENSLVAMTLAVRDGADFIQLPVHLTSDDHLVVFGDITLGKLTNAAELFPDKGREDGSHYLVDFTLQELRQLRVKQQSVDEKTGLSLGIPTLEEALILLRALNDRYQQQSGTVITLIAPEFYRGEEKEISSQLRKSLELLLYTPDDKLFIQSKDPDELQKISHWPPDANGRKYSLIQEIDLKIAPEPDFFGNERKVITHSWLLTNSGRRILATYAKAIALPGELLQSSDPATQEFLQTLDSINIKAFIDNPQVIEKQPADDTSTDPFQVESEQVKTTIDFHGIYVDSLKEAALISTQMQNGSFSKTTENKSSELPPFFSNLGLTGPTAAAPSQEGDEDKKPNEP